MQSASFQCLSCFAAFDHFLETSSSSYLVCSICGSDLIELPEPTSSEPVGTILQVSRPPISEMRPKPQNPLGSFAIPRSVKHETEELRLIRRQDLLALVGDLDIHVEVRAFGTQKSPTIGRWEALLVELGVAYADTGLDAALVGLADRVSARVNQSLVQDSPERQKQLKLLLGLWLEDQSGRLGTVLERSAVLVNWEYELDAC